MQTDLCKAVFPQQLDSENVYKLISQHFYREGLIELGDHFESESGVKIPATQKEPFIEMIKILSAIKSKDLAPALLWCKTYHQQLNQHQSSLEFDLHRLQFLHYLQQGKIKDCMTYAQLNFSNYTQDHMKSIQQLMGSLAFAHCLHFSPYAKLLGEDQWDTVMEEFKRSCWKVFNFPQDSPLYLAVTAGSDSLPTLIKMCEITKLQGKVWGSQEMLPSEIEFQAGMYQYHSVFACPVSKETCTPDNPPMLLICGHVIAKESLVKLAGANNRRFKCPYCPTEQKAQNAMQLYF